MIFCSIPLALVFSLCYAATRHENPWLIMRHALRFWGGLTLFLIVILLIMELITRFAR